MTLPVPPVTFSTPSLELPLPDTGNLQALSQRFDQILSEAPPATESAGQIQSGPTALGNALHNADTTFDRLLADSAYYTDNAQAMDSQTMTAVSMDLMMRMSMATTATTMTSGVAQSAKSTMSTLLKSQ